MMNGAVNGGTGKPERAEGGCMVYTSMHRVTGVTLHVEHVSTEHECVVLTAETEHGERLELTLHLAPHAAPVAVVERG